MRMDGVVIIEHGLVMGLLLFMKGIISTFFFIPLIEYCNIGFLSFVFSYSALLLFFLSFIIVYFFSLFFIRRQFYRRVEKEVNERLDQAMKIKERAIRIRTGFDSESITHSIEGTPKIASRKYNSVTVLFADIQGFTKIVEHLNPERLIDELDRFFLQFDMLVEKYRIEKIKTIGDAYMAAGGIPEKNSTNAVEVVQVALEIQKYMLKLQEEQRQEHEDFWELRIGIHTGPVISGRVGRNKANPDIWGDTVNIASRMESSGVAGEINITGTTYQLVKDFFVCEYRGKMPIKYKGEIDMYFIRGIMPDLSEDGLGKEPNALFGIRLQQVRFNDLEEAVLERLSNDLPKKIYYHNYKHTLDVVTQVEIIGRGEGVTEEELLLLKTAALMHDTGFLISYDDHETKSIELAKEVLTLFHYNTTQINQVVHLIEVTRPKAKPTNKLQAILKDADLDYLGRFDFINLSENLYKELMEYNGKMSPYEWTKKQYDFFSRHRYHTNTAREMRQINKEKQLEKLREIMELHLIEQ